jgi:hypothetical protein
VKAESVSRQVEAISVRCSGDPAPQSSPSSISHRARSVPLSALVSSTPTRTGLVPLFRTVPRLRNVLRITAPGRNSGGAQCNWDLRILTTSISPLRFLTFAPPTSSRHIVPARSMTWIARTRTKMRQLRSSSVETLAKFQRQFQFTASKFARTNCTWEIFPTWNHSR